MSRATARATAASSTRRTASRSSCCSIVPLDDPIKISRLTLRNISGRAAPAVGHRLCRMGARRRRAARRRRIVVTELDPRDRRAARAQSLEHRHSARASPSPTWRGRQTRWTGDRARVPRPQRHARRRRPRCVGGTPLSERVGAGLDPCAALQTRDRARARRRRPRSSSSSARRRRGRGAGADRALSRAPISTRVFARSSSTGTTCSARCR